MFYPKTATNRIKEEVLDNQAVSYEKDSVRLRVCAYPPYFNSNEPLVYARLALMVICKCE